MPPIIKIFENSQKLATAVADDFIQSVRAAKNRHRFTVALSGGTTPRLFFEILATACANRIDWQKVHIFWVDERCVPPDHPDSNYGMTLTTLLSAIDIPEINVHRMRGEADPQKEAARYHREIEQSVRKTKNGWPVFDWMLLGVGEDGHTASLFPGSTTLDESESFCVSAIHPQTGQKRITLTLPVINHTRHIIFMVSGEKKAAIVAGILKGAAGHTHLPAALVQPVHGAAEWYLDRAAAMFLRDEIV
ncbi:6-phosphogluconolactonase [candidate division KSB1 bacterium]|nr:6-phosphogluconolactonase [candidate division KSB1 bacterium]